MNLTDSYALMDRYCPGISQHFAEIAVEHGMFALLRTLADNLATTLRDLDTEERRVTLLLADAELHGLRPDLTLSGGSVHPGDPDSMPADYLAGPLDHDGHMFVWPAPEPERVDRPCPRLTWVPIGPEPGYGPSIDDHTDDLPRLRDSLDAHRSHGHYIGVGSLYHFLPTLDAAPRWAALRDLIDTNPGHGMFRSPDLLDPADVAALLPAPDPSEPTRDPR